ncbi:MAG: radical SAM protein [Gemmatimonadetes bacterium]|nr:radical SAM protein [Gemmatimonadota bacterium]NIQ59547.1 radical SAM protein [Gemmatimonadota bacterium]NIU79735.1 radical SAM protein [Gammaproteobacteria bacterium]NIX48256.1 radical SAM protein [Gemmatimonadota bacterium]NIY12697.1 radical SAM protein [Gemmatimonadota bacterium]
MPAVATIDFHVTSECSQHCTYCWGPQGYETDAVDTTTARAIIERVAALGIRRIVFTGGDPLRRADVGELMDLAKRVGLEVALSTTGDALTRRFLDAHGGSLDLVSLPLDGASEEVSSRTKEPGHFRAVMAALDLLAGFPTIDVKVATPVTRLNLEDVPEIVALLERRHRTQPNRLFYNVFQAYPRSMGEVDWSALVVTDEEFDGLRRRVGEASFPINWLSHETLDRLYVMIFPDGRVTVPSGSRFSDLGPFLEIRDLDDLLARTDFDAPKHARHARGWSRDAPG